MPYARLAAAAVALTGFGFVAPVARIEGRNFATPTPNLAIENIDLRVEQESVTSGRPQQPAGPAFWIDAELRLENTSAESLEIDLVVLDLEDHSTDTRAWVDGAPETTTEARLATDPARPEHPYTRGQALHLVLGVGQHANVRVAFRAIGSIDALGQAWLELPTQAFGLFGQSVASGTMHVSLLGRPVALQSTIPGFTHYDEPENRLTWRLHAWQPRVPFQLSYLTPWAALTLIGAAEGCPDPWTVLNETTRGNLTWLDRLAGSTNPATLELCANLPAILHGRWFDGEHTRAGLDRLTLDRYLPGAPQTSVYRPNPSFDESLVSEPEAIYARALFALLPPRNQPVLEPRSSGQ